MPKIFSRILNLVVLPGRRWSCGVEGVEKAGRRFAGGHLPVDSCRWRSRAGTEPQRGYRGPSAYEAGPLLVALQHSDHLSDDDTAFFFAFFSAADSLTNFRGLGRGVCNLACACKQSCTKKLTLLGKAELLSMMRYSGLLIFQDWHPSQAIKANVPEATSDSLGQVDTIERGLKRRNCVGQIAQAHEKTCVADPRVSCTFCQIHVVIVAQMLMAKHQSARHECWKCTFLMTNMCNKCSASPSWGHRMGSVSRRQPKYSTLPLFCRLPPRSTALTTSPGAGPAAHMNGIVKMSAVMLVPARLLYAGRPSLVKKHDGPHIRTMGERRPRRQKGSQKSKKKERTAKSRLPGRTHLRLCMCKVSPGLKGALGAGRRFGTDSPTTRRLCCGSGYQHHCRFSASQRAWQSPVPARGTRQWC